MTNRNDITNVWASDPAAFVVDPEVDVNHPSGEGGPGKTARGWQSETEPEEWENYIINLRETRVKCVAQYGKLPWDEDAYYKLGALTTYGGVTYVSIYPTNHNKLPTTQTLNWSPVKFSTAVDYLATISDMQNKLGTHTTPGQNSHNDDITSASIGGSYKATIDAQVKFVNDAVSAHAARVDNPHLDTAIGIGTIPTTGGSFLGQVNYLDNLSIGTDCELMTNASTFVSFRSKVGAIGLGVADYYKGGRWQGILTAASYPAVNQRYNPSFVMPKPDLHFPLMTNLLASNTANTLTLNRATTLAYTDRGLVAQTAAVNAPAFETLGLKLATGTSLVVAAPGVFGCRDGCISYTLNGAVVVSDVQFTNSDLTYYFGVTGNVKNFRVWSQRLTPRQKLRIPR